ncbi:DUF5819 family protein [Oerskovia flava]|uniref:DUF5819 family protein n=1 Tax=Oerskovia flava TaxID=2986422 RepID=UPI0022402BCB|nr:DUF5819 family protein [Oerskovia sp. JB1-3-2]
MANTTGSPQEVAATQVRTWQKVVAGVLSLVVGAHLAATFLWIAPSNPVRQSVAEPLTTYMHPFFQQNWSLFAPAPIAVGHSLEVRSFDAELEPTAWTDVTALEMTNLTHEVLPSRASRPTRFLAASARAQFNRLSDDELAALGGHYHSDAWPRLREAMLAAEGSSSTQRIDTVLSYDRTMAAYATEFARATAGTTGAEPVYVQFRVVRQPSRTFERRDGDLPDPTVYTFGRRPMYEYADQDSEKFREAIERFQS